MLRRRRFSRRAGQRSTRAKEWTNWITANIPQGTEPGPATVDPGFQNVNWILSPNDAQDFYDEPTLLRLIFRITCITNLGTESFAQTWKTNVAFGIILWRSDVNTIPQGTIQVFDGTHDWIWWDCIQLYHYQDEVTGISALPALGGPYQGNWDMRAKRKIPDGYGLLFCVENFDNSDTSIHFATQGRMLLANR